MRLVSFMLTKNRCFLEGRYILPKGIMVHSTGANNPRIDRYVPIGKNYSSLHWNSDRRDACVHAFIGKYTDGKIATCQTLPWNMRGWHAGTSGRPGCISANNTHISFEVCEDALLDEKYFMDAMAEATDLCAYLCKQYKFDPMADGVIISHHEGYLRNVACNHADIDHWLKRFGWTMDKFRKEVKNKMSEKLTYEEFKVYMDKYLNELYALPASEWAAKTVEMAKENGITDGRGPRALATREQVLSMILSALD